MRATIPKRASGWWGALLFLAVGSTLAAGEVLFPTPLHVVRRVEDPISKTSIELDEYYTGNKVISVRNQKSVIVDYERQEMLEIDRANGTYSVARFDEIAKSKAGSHPQPKRPPAATQFQSRWRTTALGTGSSPGGTPVDSFAIIDDAEQSVRIEVGVDRRITLNREAFDVVLGVAYPNTPPPHHESLARVCENPAATITAAVETRYGLPVEQSISYKAPDSQLLTLKTAILRLTNDLPPPEALAIPAGAKLVESRAALLLRLTREYDYSQQEPRRP